MRNALGRALLGMVAAAIAVSLAACGGAGLPEAVRTGGTGSPKAAMAAGPITGLGSIVVNGIRFDETGAQVTIAGTADRPVSELQLGMMVEVRGEIDVASRTGKADTVVATPLLSGTVGAVDATRGEVVVLGQRVEVEPGTALQGATSLAGVRAGDAVVIYGFWDYFAGHVDATRLEVRPSVAAPAPVILGKVSSTAGTRFQMGALTIETAGATLANLPAGIVAGGYVEATGAVDAAGVLRATTVTGRTEVDPVEGALTEIEGYVTDFTGIGTFRVLGLPVDASRAQLGGVAGGLANGALVEVEGRIAQGVLVATRVDVKAAVQSPPVPVAASVAGLVTDFVSVASFRVRDQAVDASRATFSRGTGADLANGRSVEIAGVLDGGLLVAAAVAFTDPVVAPGTRVVVSGLIEAFASPADFRVNGQAVTATATTSYVGGTAADLAVGRRVDVDGLLSAGILTANLVTIHPLDVPTAVSFSGVITDFVSATNFRVNNQAITTTGTTTYEEGRAADLANGRRVDIEGRLAAGVVTATKIHFADASTRTEDSEVEGLITEFVSVARFKVKGQLIDATAATYSHGGPGDLANGLKVHVKGPVTAGILKARTVEIDR